MEEYYALAYQILEGLVAIDTSNPPGNEQRAAEYLAEILLRFGISCAVQPVAPGRANLVGSFGDGERSLLFDGHLDVVPANGDWSFPPFALTRRDSRLYGRGVCDMKGGVAAMCAAAACIAGKGGPANGRLNLLFSADEECANIGLHAYQSQYPPSDYAVIGEPTELMVAVAHRGVSRSFIDVYGRAQHAALPAERDSAVLRVARLIERLDALNGDLREKTHAVLPPPGIAVTMVQGYEKDNVVPARVRVLTDFRLLPEMTQREADEYLRQAAKQAGVEDYRLEQHFFMHGGQISPDDAFAKTCCRVGGELLGRALSPCAFDASCEQCFLVEQGTKAVICGPGSLAQAHTSDEYIEEKQLNMAVDFYIRLAMEVLK